MNNIEKLKEIDELGVVRQRLSAENAEDAQFDEEINKLTNNQLIAKICGWKLGDEDWWYEMKSQFDHLESLEEK